MRLCEVSRSAQIKPTSTQQVEDNMPREHTTPMTRRHRLSTDTDNKSGDDIDNRGLMEDRSRAKSRMQTNALPNFAH